MILTSVKWAFWGTVWVLTFAFLHYTIPQIDVVRVTAIDDRPIVFGENSIFWAQEDSGQAADDRGRHVRFIDTFYDNEDPTRARPMVFRNEDTGFGWPPYFKFNSSDVQAIAGNNISTGEDPKWVAVRHYGWRNQFYSIFPNAIKIWPVDGPNDKPWNVIGIILWVLAGMVLWFLTARWIKFRRKVLAPAYDSVEGGVTSAKEGVTGWLDTWKSKPRR